MSCGQLDVSSHKVLRALFGVGCLIFTPRWRIKLKKIIFNFFDIFGRLGGAQRRSKLGSLPLPRTIDPRAQPAQHNALTRIPKSACCIF